MNNVGLHYVVDLCLCTTRAMIHSSQDRKGLREGNMSIYCPKITSLDLDKSQRSIFPQENHGFPLFRRRLASLILSRTRLGIIFYGLSISLPTNLSICFPCISLPFNNHFDYTRFPLIESHLLEMVAEFCSPLIRGV